MADMARFKHIASGGKWKSEEGWVEPGELLKQFFRTSTDLQDLLGWRDPQKVRTGTYFYTVTAVDND